MSSTQQLLLGEGAGGPPALYIEDVFSTYLYVGNDTSQTITNNIDLSTKGGLVWIKSRSGTYDTGYHVLNDTVRGAQKALFTNTTGAQSTNAQGLTAFTSTGFSVGNSTDVNGGTTNMVSWTFREQPKFFDIVTYTGNGTSGTAISHNLGSTPGCIIIKKTSAGGSDSNWVVWHRALPDPVDGILYLNTTNAQMLQGWFSSINSTSFTITSNSNINQTSATYVAYLFAHNAGGFGAAGTDNVISCGSFTTDGSGNATVNLGYEPQWILVKQTDGADSWRLLDNMRGMPTSGQDGKQLFPNTSAAEQTVSPTWGAPTATGFNFAYAGSSTYIYIAIRRGPMKVPTLGTNVFAVNSLNAPPYPSWISNFPVDMAIMRYNANTTDDPQLGTRLIGAQQLLTSTNAVETSNATFTFDYNNGWGLRSGTTANWYSWMFRRAPGYFDVVCFTGTKPTVQTVTHNLGVAPELLIVKNRGSAGSWRVWNTTIAAANAANFITLDTDYFASADNAYFNSTAPTASVFTVGTDNDTNMAGVGLVAYLFATCAGVSKVGSYTGTAATQTINCGFTGGARYVLVKSTSAIGNWYFWDSFRGIVAGNDPYLTLDTTAAEVTGTDWVDTNSTGFELSNAGGNLANSNGVSYIFLAIA